MWFCAEHIALTHFLFLFVFGRNTTIVKKKCRVDKYSQESPRRCNVHIANKPSKMAEAHIEFGSKCFKNTSNISKAEEDA
jgi:hypothetical protein